jgi:hypothetical protein
MLEVSGVLRMKNESIQSDDNLGFPMGIMIVVFAYAIGFGVYNWGYGNGHDTNKCKENHGYKFTYVRPAFMEVK